MARGSEDTAGKWCILRTAAPRTLLLARSLVEAGFEVWTPSRTEGRAGRGKERHKLVERVLPITPTFVFADGRHALDLAVIARAPMSPHPAFSVLRRQDRGIAMVHASGLQPLRNEEERLRFQMLKKTRRSIAPGTSIRLQEGPFAGMTGIVERGDGKAAVVNFGAGFIVTIASYLIGEDVVQGKNSPVMGIAA